MSLHKRQSQGAQFKHFPVLDGVRGIAVLMVVVTHFGSLSPGNYHYFHPGLLGVDIFFVLSTTKEELLPPSPLQVQQSLL